VVITSKYPTLKDVKNVEEKIVEFKPQVVIGVGGGTKIDIAKLGAARQGIPVISVPTTASHDGITSPFVSIKGSNKPYSIYAQSPIAVIADTSVIIKAPSHQLISGCGDVISKFTSTCDWKLAHERKKEYYAQYAANLALMSANHIVDNVDLLESLSEKGLRILLEALVSSGVAMGIAGSSKPCSGSEHLFSHALDLIMEKKSMHGAQCGLGTIMMASLHGLDWNIIRKTLIKIGAPTTAENLEIDPKYVIEALLKAKELRPERYTILHEKSLNQKTAYELAKKTGVIK
jgi:glycerol-1-phosphate dehydrogenase [NAD(P)+]